MHGQDTTLLHDQEEGLKQLQATWESVSVTAGGKQLATGDGSGGLLLQSNGNTFAVTERKPDGEKSDPNTGRIEIRSATDSKTLDFMGRNLSDRRSLGVFEFKKGGPASLPSRKWRDGCPAR